MPMVPVLPVPVANGPRATDGAKRKGCLRVRPSLRVSSQTRRIGITRRCSAPLRAIQHEGPEIQKGRSVSGAIGLIGVSIPARQGTPMSGIPPRTLRGFEVLPMLPVLPVPIANDQWINTGNWKLGIGNILTLATLPRSVPARERTAIASRRDSWRRPVRPATAAARPGGTGIRQNVPTIPAAPPPAVAGARGDCALVGVPHGANRPPVVAVAAAPEEAAEAARREVEVPRAVQTARIRRRGPEFAVFAGVVEVRFEAVAGGRKEDAPIRVCALACD